MRRADEPDAYVRWILINASRRNRVGEHTAEPAGLPDTATGDLTPEVGERSILVAARGMRR